MIHRKKLDDFELVNVDNENSALLEFPQHGGAHAKYSLTARVSRGVKSIKSLGNRSAPNCNTSCVTEKVVDGGA
jgi:hypothetical protein